MTAPVPDEPTTAGVDITPPDAAPGVEIRRSAFTVPSTTATPATEP